MKNRTARYRPRLSESGRVRAEQDEAAWRERHEDRMTNPQNDGETLCTFGPPTERQRHWILKFEDRDVGDMHFVDEPDAMRAFERYSQTYTCTLFVTAEFVAEREYEPGVAPCDDAEFGMEPMNDIAERLRQGVGHCLQDTIDAEKLMDTAADEIARLTRQLAEARAALKAISDLQDRSFINRGVLFGQAITLARAALPQPAAMAASEITPHEWVPSIMHQGDCDICGHVQDAPIHKAAELRKQPREDQMQGHTWFE